MMIFSPFESTNRIYDFFPIRDAVFNTYDLYSGKKCSIAG